MIGDALQYKVVWNSANKSVTFSNGEGSYEFADVVLKNSRSYVPLRKISEQLGYKVNYRAEATPSLITISH